MGHRSGVSEAVFAGPDARRAVTVSRDHSLKLWDFRRPPRDLATFRGHADSVTCCAVRGELLLSGSRDQTLRTWLLPP